jgi:hypothetical protein
MTEKPKWKVVAADGYANNGMLWPRGARFESWDLPRDFVSLRPLDELAERIAAYSERVGLHHLARPVRAVDGFLPAMLRVGNQWTGPYCAEVEGMPRYDDDARPWLGWPSKYDKPSNAAAARVLAYWLGHRRHPDLEEHGCWNVVTNALHLPWLRVIAAPERVPLDGREGNARLIVDRPGSGYGQPLDGRADSPMVPYPSMTEQPRIRTRTHGEATAARRGEA